MNSLSKISNNNISNYINLDIYIAWDKIKKSFYRPQPSYNNNCKLIAGIWTSKEDAKTDTKDNHIIIYINMRDNIHPDFIRIFQLDSELFSKDEKKRMIRSKFVQILEIFIFRNKELKEQLEEKYK